MLNTKILNNNKDFLNLYRKGKSIVSGAVVLYVAKNNRPYNRLGITAGKKIGNEVSRNRAKRIIRQAYRENEALFPVGLDIVIVARGMCTQVKSDYVSRFLASRGQAEINAMFG